MASVQRGNLRCPGLHLGLHLEVPTVWTYLMTERFCRMEVLEDAQYVHLAQGRGLPTVDKARARIPRDACRGLQVLTRTVMTA